MAIECKDLEVAPTHGEIARQMVEFRGEEDARGRPDRLKRHIERVHVLNERLDSVSRYVKLDLLTQVAKATGRPVLFRGDNFSKTDIEAAV